MDPCPLVHAHQDSSSNSDRPHAAEIHAYRMPYCCLLGVSSHSPGCGVMFPTIQKNISQLVPSDHYTNPHNSCLCWWKSLKKECFTDPCVTTSYVLEISPPWHTARVLKLVPKMVCAMVFLAEAIHEECFDLLKSIVILYGVIKK